MVLIIPRDFGLLDLISVSFSNALYKVWQVYEIICYPSKFLIYKWVNSQCLSARERENEEEGIKSDGRKPENICLMPVPSYGPSNVTPRTGASSRCLGKRTQQRHIKWQYPRIIIFQVPTTETGSFCI